MRIMLESVRLRVLLIPFVAAALTVACGEGTALQSPTGPSPSQGPAALLANDAIDRVATTSSAGEFDTLAKGGNGKGKDKSAEDDADTDATSGQPENGGGNIPDNGNGGPGRSHEARVVGFVSANDGTTLTVDGVAIVPGTDAVIRHGNRDLTMADIEVGDHVQARGTLEGSTLVATEIKVQDTGHDNDDV